MGFGSFVKGARKFGNKMAKGTSMGLKKASSASMYLGKEISDAGDAMGNEQLQKVGDFLMEGGQIAGQGGALIERLRTAKSGREIGEIVSEGQVLGSKGIEFGKKVYGSTQGT